MTTSTRLADLADEQFVSLTTFRHSGQGVPTPVWVAADGPDLLVTTEATTGKVTRILHNPRVTVRPCTGGGRVAPGAPEVTAYAVVVDDPAEVRRLSRFLRRKYGLLAGLF